MALSSSLMMVDTRSGLAKNVQQVVDDGHDFFVLGHDLVLLQARQALQAHLQDFLRLGF
jgi:hypothetical protein